MRENFKKMSLQELAMVLGWAQNEGWNPGKFDYKSYYELDPDGFLLLEVDNKPIGSISLVKYSPQFAFIGLFIIISEYRGQGYGKKLWQRAMELLNDFATLELYAVPREISRYEHYGFFADKRKVNHRWQLPSSIANNITQANKRNNNNKALLYNKMISYDQKLWGFSRKKFFDTMLRQPYCFALVTLKKTKEISGYGVIRPCQEGYRIGPIYCDHVEYAKNITHALIGKIPSNSQIIFDIPSVNKFEFWFADYFNLKRIDTADTVAMFKGEQLYKNEETCYGLASLEIG